MNGASFDPFMQQSFYRTLPKFYRLGFLRPLFTQRIKEQNGSSPLFKILHNCFWKELALKSDPIMLMLFKLFCHITDT